MARASRRRRATICAFSEYWSSIELRAGSSGAVVATLVSSEFHKLARYRDEIDVTTTDSGSVGTTISQDEKKAEKMLEKRRHHYSSRRRNFRASLRRLRPI